MHKEFRTCVFTVWRGTMEKNKRTNETDCYIESSDYKNMLIEIIDRIENQGALEYLYTFTKLFIEKWG